MIFSKEKRDDIEARREILEEMEYCLSEYKRTGREVYQELAIGYGKMSQEMAERIATLDYTERDRARNWIDRLFKRVQKGLIIRSKI